MKRLILLQVGYNPSPAIRAKALNQFREDIKQWSDIKIIKEIEPKAQVIIEFSDNKYQEIYDNLRQLEVIEVIDSQLPLEI